MTPAAGPGGIGGRARRPGRKHTILELANEPIGQSRPLAEVESIWTDGDGSVGLLAFPTSPPGLRPTTPVDRIGHSYPTLEEMPYIPTMPKTRAIPTLAVSLIFPILAWGQNPAPTTPPAPPAQPTPTTDPTQTADKVLLDAIYKLHPRERVAAKIHQEVSMLNQQFSVEGEFFKDAGLKIRLKLELVGLGDSSAIMSQVSDGKVLWDYYKVLSAPKFEKLELAPILKRFEDNPDIRDDAIFKDLILSHIGLSGPDAMLSGLRTGVKFDQLGSEKLGDIDVWVLGGTWVDRTGLMQGDRPLPPTVPLPPYIPSNIRLFLGKADLWPYKVEMIGNAPSLLQMEDTRPIGPDGRPVGVRKAPPKVDPSRVILTYTPLPDADIKPELFVFSAPPDATNLMDKTDPFLANMDMAIAQHIASKKAEAAKSEGGPLIKETLTAPSPGATDPVPVPSPK